MQCKTNTKFVCSSHATGDLMLIAVDQKDRAMERNCSPYILKPVALQPSDTYIALFSNHLRQLRMLAKPILSILHT